MFNNNKKKGLLSKWLLNGDYKKKKKIQILRFFIFFQIVK